MRKRYFKKKPRNTPKGYDSMLEYNLHQDQLKGYDHHPEPIAYVSHHVYEADFVDPDEPNILIESKGRFVDKNSASKMLWVRKSNPDKEIVFIFEKPETPMPFAKKRKDGTKQSHGEWATKNGFRWFTPDTIPESWRK